jgi:hypothetical protein
MKTKFKSAVDIIEDVNGPEQTFLLWSRAETALNMDSLRVSKQICVDKLSDGDTQQDIRLELNNHHQNIIKTLKKLEDHLTKFDGRIEPKKDMTFIVYAPTKPERPQWDTPKLDTPQINTEFIIFAVLSILALGFMIFKEV